MNLKDKLSIKAEPVEKALAKYLKIKEPKKLYEAMAHIPLSGGKRLRPVMALLACELVGGVVKKAVPFATAIEILTPEKLPGPIFTIIEKFLSILAFFLLIKSNILFTSESLLILLI